MHDDVTSKNLPKELLHMLQPLVNSTFHLNTTTQVIELISRCWEISLGNLPAREKSGIRKFELRP